VNRRIGTQALVFVVDSADRARIDEARTELHRIINDREMKDCFLLVFANKQDIAGGELPFSNVLPCQSRSSALVDHLLTFAFPNVAMKPHEITEKLQLAKLKDRLWYVQPSVAPAGDGLFEGFEWMSDRIKELPKK